MADDPYRTIARIYDRLIEPLNSKLKGLGLRMCPPAPGQKVLDIGCGTGTLLEQYRDGGATITGIDPSPSMLDKARYRLGPDAALVLADAQRTPFSGESFDLVTVTMVLHELPPIVRTAVLDEASRVLRPQGKILAIDFHDGPLVFPKGWVIRTLVTFVERAAGRKHFAGFRHFVTHGALPQLAADRGIRVETTRILGNGNMAVLVLTR